MRPVGVADEQGFDRQFLPYNEWDWEPDDPACRLQVSSSRPVKQKLRVLIVHYQVRL